MRLLLLLAAACDAVAPPVSRRKLAQTSVAYGSWAGLSTRAGPCAAAAPMRLTTSFLRRRVDGRNVTLVDLGPGAPDIFYPSYFEGRWSSSSTTVAVEAPCGAQLFGGERNLEAARAEVGTAVDYATLFFRDGRPNAAGAIVADRPFNIRALVEATMGTTGDGGKPILRSIPSSANFDANSMKFELSPAGSNGRVYAAAIRVVSRYVNALDDDNFETVELVRQSISDVGNPLAPPSIKDVETINLFQRVSDDIIISTQRTASFIFPSDPRAAVMADMAGGRAIDLRSYKVEYRRLAPAAA
ncbi:hypothetical protein M885DRAFT_590347 [Pelagophyceae sp. CCMP2097]|nr:hypothetical protein M885DRAFT_590347 [Pelagophyceae sp. CCMP2097]